MNKKGKLYKFLFTVTMTIIFVFITEFLIFRTGNSILYDSIINYPKGNFVIDEAILAVLVLIVMLLFKNSYVLTQEKQKIGTGLFYGLFHIIFSVAVIILFGGLMGALKEPQAVLNLAIACICVGIFEEFLCRGWLLNEFLERFGETKKGIWYSIIVSGIIFGLLHVMNIAGGQDVIGTIIQVISAAASGIVFGLIYYKTKNIWSVVLLHGLWDFSLMLTEIRPVYESIETTTNFSVIGMIFTILMALAELLIIIPHLKDLDAKPRKSSVIGFSFIAVALYCAFFMVNAAFSGEQGEMYKYENINMNHYAVTQDNYEEYYIKNNQYSFKLSSNDKNNLVITNMNTSYSVEIESKNLYDYIIYKDNDNYIIAYVDFIDTENTFLKYRYIPISSLSNSNEFLNSLKNDFKKYLLPGQMNLCIISDDTNEKTYLSAYDVDYGYYLLIGENQMSILNRDN